MAKREPHTEYAAIAHCPLSINLDMPFHPTVRNSGGKGIIPELSRRLTKWMKETAIATPGEITSSFYIFSASNC